jgi:hypothetical protein
VFARTSFLVIFTFVVITAAGVAFVRCATGAPVVTLRTPDQGAPAAGEEVQIVAQPDGSASQVTPVWLSTYLAGGMAGVEALPD